MDVKLVTVIATGSILAAASGYGASLALGQEPGGPVRTVTVDVGTGEQGPPGEPGPPGATGPAGATGETGPAGPAGGQICSTGFEKGVVVFNAPGGQVALETCLKEE